MDERRGLFTIGHSNHSMETFVVLLAQHGVVVLVDTRTSPFSRFVPHFNRESLQSALKRAGIAYLFLGAELGGRPDGDEFYDEDGHVLYHRLAESERFLAGIARLEKGIRDFRVAIMCSEEDPGVCHRHLLVGRVMARRGAEVRHIRADGRVQADADVPTPEQERPSLFTSFEDNPWKSLRSVSPRKPPNSSSASFDDMESDD